MSDPDFADILLNWYDGHARDLPWRIGPAERDRGRVPDAYRVWLSEIMLQQTTVVTVKDYFERFTARWPTVAELAAARDSDVMAEWAGLGYYARARNLLKCARLVVDDFGGVFPRTYAGLLGLPGVGPYTAAAIAAIAYDQPEVVVDGNVKRVMARYFAVEDTLDKALPELVAYAKGLTPQQRSGDYAQAIMDLGATVCTPRNPNCRVCPCAAGCRAHRLGIAAELPKRAVKVAKPTRRGIIYVARRTDGAWLLERRPNKGLLGGMLGWPGSEWGDDPQANAPMAGAWVSHNELIRHTFTHFHLQLTLQTLVAHIGCTPGVGEFLAGDAFARSDLPTVMRKAYDAALLAVD